MHLAKCWAIHKLFIHLIGVLWFFCSFITNEKFYIDPLDQSSKELLVIDRVTREISLQGMISHCEGWLLMVTNCYGFLSDSFNCII